MTLLYLALTYLLASVPFGLVVTTLYGGDVDIRAAGSGRTGATNVARVYGWRMAAPVVLLDAGKGFFPVLLAGLLWPEGGVLWAGLVGIVAFIGHCWPVYLEFRGGKGITTAAGVVFAMAPIQATFAMAAWMALLLFTGRSSVASLGSTLCAVVLIAVFRPWMLPVAVVLAAGLAYTHFVNLQRLLRGDEAALIRSVRWGRGRSGDLSAEDVLRQAPSGRDVGVAVWREPVPDPLEERE